MISIFIFISGATLLVYSAERLISSLVGVSRGLAIFLTARPIKRGVPEIGIGNVIGSLIFSVTGKLGIVVLAGGSVAIGSSVLRWHLLVLIVMTGIAACFLWTGRLNRWHGVVLLTMYVAYSIISYVMYGGAPLDD